MAANIKLKRSAVQSRVPTTSDLELGELGLNTYDGKVYMKKDDGTAAIIEVGGSGGGGATDIDDLTDVDTSTVAPTDGQLLIYDNAASKWKPGDVSVDDLSDVDTSTVAPTDGQALLWNNTASQWEPNTVGGINSTIAGMIF